MSAAPTLQAPAAAAAAAAPAARVLSCARPRVSIGLPVYNGGAFLVESIESLLGQTYQDIELIISDNASDDGSSQLCARFAAADPRIRYTRLSTNIGGVRNHDRVRQLASGEYFMWASSDDLWRPTYIERCIELMQADPGLVLVYAVNATMNGSGDITGAYPSGYALDTQDVIARFRQLTQTDTPIEPFYGVMRRGALSLLPALCLHPGFDRFLLAELGLLGRFRQIPEALYVRRIHAEQSVRAFPTLRDRYRWMNSGTRTRFALPHLEYAARFSAAALRSAPGWSAKLACLWHMLKWCNWNRKALWGDLVRAR